MEQTLALIVAAHGGCREAREQLVRENMGLVYTVARRFLGRGYDIEDLTQIGCIGLIKAIDKFDTSFEVRFSTYAVPMISGEIKRFLRDDGMIKVSRSLKEMASKVAMTREQLEQKTGREPTLEEISSEIGVSREEIVEAMESRTEVESLSRTVYQGDGNEILLEERLESGIDASEILLNHMFLDTLLGSLGPGERELIRLRYFEELTQIQVAHLLGMTQVQVSRYEKKILKKMKNSIGEE